MTPAGWYPDPSTGQQRYWDGTRWGPTAPPPAPMQPAGVVVSGPNHAVHGILTLFTFWMCGGWAWIWLIVALVNNKRVQPVDAYGNPIPRPMRQGPPAPDVVKDFFTLEDGSLDQRKVWIAVGVFVAAVVVLFVASAIANA
jgi:hypothetical protein